MDTKNLWHRATLSPNQFCKLGGHLRLAEQSEMLKKYNEASLAYPDLSKLFREYFLT